MKGGSKGPFWGWRVAALRSQAWGTSGGIEAVASGVENPHVTGFEEQLGNPGQVLQPPTSSCSKAVRSGTGAVVQAHGGNRPLRGTDNQQTTLMVFCPNI